MSLEVMYRHIKTMKHWEMAACMMHELQSSFMHANRYVYTLCTNMFTPNNWILELWYILQFCLLADKRDIWLATMVTAVHIQMNVSQQCFKLSESNRQKWTDDSMLVEISVCLDIINQSTFVKHTPPCWFEIPTAIHCSYNGKWQLGLHPSHFSALWFALCTT